MSAPGGRDAPAGPETIHASTVALPVARGPAPALLLLGPSGSGKSGLALQLIALGARLVADDRTCLARRGDLLIASAPPAIRGLIEARGIGLLRLTALAEAAVVAAVDLGQTETRRLPGPRDWRCFGLARPLLHKVETDHFPAALMAYLASHGGKWSPRREP